MELVAKLKLGDMVKSMNPDGQIKSPGVIVAMINGHFYEKTMLPPTMNLDVAWGANFPNWRNEGVAIVWFNEPQRTATLEEWVRTGVAQGFREEDCRKNYEAQCKLMNYTVFPLADLEVCDEEVALGGSGEQSVPES